MELQGSEACAETIAVLQRSMDAGIKDYDLLMEGNKSALAECNALCKHSEDLESELTKARTSAEEGIASLEARIKSVQSPHRGCSCCWQKTLN
jgi:hypothetical protein